MLIVGLVLLAPSSALANPLLSGYGGPGQGEQAILGGGLVNGPSGGSPGGGSSSISTPATQGPAAGAASSSSGASSHGSTSHALGRAPTSSQTRRHGGGGASTTTPAVRSPALGHTSSVSTAASSQLLGLSGEDIIYVVLILALLIVTATVVKRLAGRPGAGETG